MIEGQIYMLSYLPDQVESLVVFFMLKANTGLLRLLLFFQYIPIPICNNTIHDCTRQNTLYFIILAPLYTFVLEVHVCIKVTLKGELSSIPASSFGRAPV